jgi:hypothetical protein
MDSNTYNIDELRRQWKLISAHAENLEQRNADLIKQLRQNHRSSLRQQLIRHRVWYIILCGVFPVISLPQLLWLNTSWAFVAAYTLFFWILAVVDMIILYRIKRLNIYTMTVDEALRQVYAIRQSILLRTVLGVCMATPLLVWLFTILSDNGTACVIGGSVGAVVGFVWGLFIYLREQRALRQLRSEFQQNE